MTLSLLKFPGKILDPEDNFYIIVEGSHFLPDWKDDKIGDHSQYYFEEHTCPINFLRVPTIFRNETDYHGIFTWVKTIPFPTKEEFDKITNYSKYVNFDLPWGLAGISVFGIEELFDLSDDQKLYVPESEFSNNKLVTKLNDLFTSPFKYVIKEPRIISDQHKIVDAYNNTVLYLSKDNIDDINESLSTLLINFLNSCIEKEEEDNE